ncbi:aldehyde dehydrogenase [Devosia sp. 17-2-E-8]|nr:aldehyde dehydrogenase [Devosia sp. 17-2-E-8]
MNPYALVIDGKRVETVAHAEVRNPSTGETVGLMPLATPAQLDLAVQAAARAFKSWSRTSDAERKKACHAVADIIAAHQEELALLLTLEQGKPLNGLGSRFEMGGTLAWTRYTADLTLPVEILQDNNEGRVELHRKPIGVVGSITPWNWPVMIASWHIIPAIRAGNAVVLKPSPQTPLSTIRMIELVNEVLPPGVVNVITGDNALAALMTAHPGIDKMTFTGSAETGRKVMASAAATLKRLTLELGGNDAGIVLGDADPKQIAQGLFWGAFINNGQTCSALKRLYVHDSLYDAVCDELAAYARTVTIGDGQDEASILGPIQNEMQFNKVRDLVEDARARGGRILTGGAPIERPGYFYPITLVADLDHGFRLVDEEQFGPALPIIRYSDIDEVIERANSLPVGLGGSIWSSNIEKARELAGRLECGIAWVNKHGAIQPNAPHGGIKQSGIGVQFGVEGLKELTVAQTVLS